MKEFKKIGDPVKQRHFYYSELNVYYDQFDTIVKNIQSKMGTVETCTDDRKEEVNTKVTAAQTFMEGVKADQNGKQPHQDPAYNLDGILLTLETLKKET